VNDAATHIAPLPEPTRGRWQPLRLGLVELYHYDYQEFYFRDGRLLLRGNNGTGKSKVLSLTLPLLLDANLSPARVEPDGDRGKRMEWNLLMGRRHERRIGYTWIEFARVTDAGPEFLTLGCGLKAAAGQSRVTSWFFTTDRRPGEDLWLIGPDRRALAREQLIDALGERGRVFDVAKDYRRALDERLFQLGEERYRALMDTLIQLRQPQLSKQPNEQALSAALTNALAPLSRDLLEDVAEAMNQLEEYRAELADSEAMLAAVGAFNERYRAYASVLARRRARDLRQAQSAYEKASREVNEADAALADAETAVEQQRAELQSLTARLDRARVALKVLRDSPAMRDAEALARAEQRAGVLAEDAADADRDAADARTAHEDEAARGRERAEAADQARGALDKALDKTRAIATSAGIERDFEHAFGAIDSGDNADATEKAGGKAGARAVQRLHTALDRRREQIDRIMSLIDELGETRQTRSRREDEHRNRQADCERLAERIAAETRAMREAGDELVSAWRAALADARQLDFDAEGALGALAEWIEVAEDDNPMRAVAAAAESAARERLATRASTLKARRAELDAEREALQNERDRLAAGVDRPPPAPYTRGEDIRAERPGAPLWRLIDFDSRVGQAARAGLEAALEAAGLLDAWVLPEGALLDARTHDTVLTPAPPAAAPLAERLHPAIDTNDPGAAQVSAATLDALLAGIDCGDTDAGDGRAWIAPDGRFRLGPARGAWQKSSAEYIGAGAREAARRRRLAEIDAALAELAQTERALESDENALASERTALQEEIAALPRDAALREAHAALGASETQHRAAREQRDEARERLAAAEAAERRARKRLETDASDLALPTTPAELRGTTAIVERCAHETDRLRHAVVEHHRARIERRLQAERETQAQEALQARRAVQERKARAARRAASERDTLRDTVGADAAAVERKVVRAESDVQQAEDSRETAQERLSRVSEARGAARGHAAASRETLAERAQQRGVAVEVLNAFAGTGLLAIAVPDIEVAPRGWRVDPALQAARRTEQALTAVEADDDSWRRVQGSLGRDIDILRQALAARGHRATSEPRDDGLVVRIVVQNREERPDRLVERLRADTARRRELLSAREREVIENHLEAEIATELQRLIQSAERRVATMNAELGRRPTSTGVKFKLEWQPRPEGDGGAPTGIGEARRRLLRTVADAWSAEDRQVVGRFLQNCIDAERARDDAATTLEALTAALDYRRWHAFRVKRWQDGNWRPLSGPASSGERALGLTVPLFAAASSHYESAAAFSPRLVLLDEAFAGIDDAARASCMGLMREFDLDFVMTSEREWGCYQQVPGLAICQLVRHEGIDAVFVSPWSWDGRTRREEKDATRRAPAAMEAGE
jgi:uncharacterized protein (TIGR02680 family)